MINPVNFNPIVQNATATTSQQVTTQPNQNHQVNNPNMNGLNALAAYNQPITNTATATPKTIQPTLPTVLTPAAIHSMEGEKITSANGTLNAIIKRNEKTTTVYKMDMQAPNDDIRKIETYDNSTGKLVAVQNNYNNYENGKNPVIISTEIIEYNDAGKEKKATYYYKGKLENVVETHYGPNNFERRCSVYSDGSSTIFENCKDTESSRIFKYDTKGQVTEIEIMDKKNNSSKVDSYKDGKLIRSENIELKAIPNTTGKNPQQDTELLATQPYILGYDPKQVQGEKQYYSHGSIERITTKTATGSITHTFDINGTLTGIEDAQNPDNVKYVVYHNNGEYYSVEEKLGDNLLKNTTFAPDGSKEVCVMNETTKQEKIAIYRNNGSLAKYIEYNSPEDKMMMSFNKNGELVRVE